MKLDSSRSFQSAAEVGDQDPDWIDEITDGSEGYDDTLEFCLSWSSDLSLIPFDVEVTVAWNFTNSTHTKSIVIRHSDTPSILWLDNSQHQFITIEDARYWMGYPELPRD